LLDQVHWRAASSVRRIHIQLAFFDQEAHERQRRFALRSIMQRGVALGVAHTQPSLAANEGLKSGQRLLAVCVAGSEMHRSDAVHFAPVRVKHLFEFGCNRGNNRASARSREHGLPKQLCRLNAEVMDLQHHGWIHGRKRVADAP
jgi:hypothetical protein